MVQRYWLIQGFYSDTKFFDRRVKVGYYSTSQMSQLLKTLVSKAGLDYEEILGAYAKHNVKLSNDLLDVHVSHKPFRLACGDNPYFIATVVSDINI